MSTLVVVILYLVCFAVKARQNCDVRWDHCLSYMHLRSDKPRF